MPYEDVENLRPETKKMVDTWVSIYGDAKDVILGVESAGIETYPTRALRALASLREVSAIVDAKAPNEAAAFKAWLREISREIAEAAVEGSFLGFGGVRVSDAERATLRDISKALGMAS